MFRRYCVAKRKPLMSQRVLVLAVLAASALTAGCQSGPRVTPNLALPAGFEAPANPAGMAAAPLDAWWTAFADPALNGLIETARDHGARRCAPADRSSSSMSIVSRQTFAPSRNSRGTRRSLFQSPAEATFGFW